jgi:hypothetical protein
MSVSSFKTPKLWIEFNTTPRLKVGRLGSIQKKNSCDGLRGGNDVDNISIVNGLNVSSSHSKMSAITRGVDD